MTVAAVQWQITRGRYQRTMKAHPMLTKTLVLDDLLDPAQGWEFSPRQVPIEYAASDGGNPLFLLTIDGTRVVLFERTEWPEGTNRASAMRICLFVQSSMQLRDPLAVCEMNMLTTGLPAWAVDEQGHLAVVYALPFSEDFPLEFLRKQLLVAISLAISEMQDITNAVAEAEKTDAQRNTRRSVASVAARFARAFLR